MAMSAADILLEALKSQRIEYVFCSPGTEWVPVWEGLARLYSRGDTTLRYINCRHEGLAISAASGYAKATGRLSAVLLHASVGPLHAAMEIRAAYRARTPMIIFTGESSGYGEGDKGNSQWLGRLTDIGGPPSLVRSYVKWSNSVTSKETLLDSIYRGCQIAQTPPRGPVFLSMPWEFLLQSFPEIGMVLPSPPVVPPEPRLSDVNEVAELLVESKQPIIITEYAGEKPDTVRKLIEVAELLSIPVFECIDPAFGNFPRNHPLHAGYDASPALREADTVFIVGATTPWHPPSAFPKNGARVILLDEGVLKEHLPYWGYRVNLMLSADIGRCLAALADSIRDHVKQPAGHSPYQKRLEYWQAKHQQLMQDWETRALAEQRKQPISSRWLLYALSKVLPSNSIVLDETVGHRLLVRQYLAKPDGYFKVGSGGLGIGLGIAGGVKFAHRDRPVILLVGDGSFSYNPVPAGLGLFQEYGLPVLTVIFNNAGYITMKRGHQRCYSEGWAARTNMYLGVDIAPEPDYVRLAEAFNAYGQRVDKPEDIEAAVTEALQHMEKGKAALLNVILDQEV